MVLDSEFINRRFATNGGIKRLNVVLDDQLNEVLNALNTGLWQAG